MIPVPVRYPFQAHCIMFLRKEQHPSWNASPKGEQQGKKNRELACETVVCLWFIDPKDGVETSSRIQQLWNLSSSLSVVLLSQNHGKLKRFFFSYLSISLSLIDLSIYLSIALSLYLSIISLFSSSEHSCLMFFLWLGRTSISPPLDSVMFTYITSAWSRWMMLVLKTWIFFLSSIWITCGLYPCSCPQKSIKLHLVFPHVVWLHGHIKVNLLKRRLKEHVLSFFPVFLEDNHTLFLLFYLYWYNLGFVLIWW